MPALEPPLLDEGLPVLPVVGELPSSKLSELFGIDTRTLALFRVVIGALLLFDLIARGQHLSMMYTDAGIVPLAARGAFPDHLSLHWISGSFGFQLFLFSFHIAAAMALLVGYRTRLATLVCWLLLTSLHFRSPHLNDGGDAIARMLLLWSIFLPLGARFSLDARRAAGAVVGRLCTPATAAILLQFVLFYTVAGITKNGPAWLDGSAVAAAIDNSYWSRPFGDALLGYPALLEFLTFATRGFEIFGPLLLFVPVFTAQIRLATILGFWSFQLGLATSLELNLFPFFSSSATLVFIPSWFWDRFFPATRLEASRREEEPDRSVRHLIESGFVIALVVASFTLATATIGWISSPRALNRAARYVGFEQSWTMYAPHPPPFDLHFRVLGHRSSGEIITLLASDSDVDHGESWREIAELHGGYRLKDHLEHLMLLGREVEPLRQAYLDWVCRTWNRVHPDQLIANAAYVGVSRRTLTDREETQAPLMLAERVCQ